MFRVKVSNPGRLEEFKEDIMGKMEEYLIDHNG